MDASTEPTPPGAINSSKQLNAEEIPASTDQPRSNRSREQNRKRKRGGHSRPVQHGSRGKGRDMGRNQYMRESQLDRRARNDVEKEKRRKVEVEGASDKPDNLYPALFSREEIAAEERRPKKKVAVLIGYSGTGYRGMQIMPNAATIEGDLFKAFVGAGAISKANADDPKKSALVRCARTDKGVHAAGNVVSLKLIVEDDDIVEKINSHLSPQIRVWGFEKTIGSFSCYQACDSRWYEYLLPTHTLLPPHPNTFLGKKLVELAQEADDIDGYDSRQEEVKDFWAEAEKKHIRPVLDELDTDTRKRIEEALYNPDEETEPSEEDPQVVAAEVEAAADIGSTEELESQPMAEVETTVHTNGTAAKGKPTNDPPPSTSSLNPQVIALREATKKVKAAYLAARNSYRISPARFARLQEALNAYVGTHNFHNFTVRKTAKDPSCKRHIKSFVVNPDPIVKDGIEWLSLKVHGQSFMMHQIRKMVGLAALVVRCGCPMSRVAETLTHIVVSIPKAPALGLLLERPVFDSYNKNQAAKFDRSTIDFSKYETEMQKFKDREIYARMFKEEEEEGVYSAFFAHLDGYKEPFFLYLSSMGMKAAGDARKVRTVRGSRLLDEDSDDERVQGGEEG